MSFNGEDHKACVLWLILTSMPSGDCGSTLAVNAVAKTYSKKLYNAPAGSRNEGVSRSLRLVCTELTVPCTWGTMASLGRKLCRFWWRRWRKRKLRRWWRRWLQWQRRCRQLHWWWKLLLKWLWWRRRLRWWWWWWLQRRWRWRRYLH